MPETGDVPQSLDFPVEGNLRKTLESVLPKINSSIADLPGISSINALSLEPTGATLRNTQLIEFNGGFGFWGSLEHGFQGHFRGPTAIVKDVKVPEKGKGVGTALIKTWEEELHRRGVNYFAATTLKFDERAVNFWTKLGYSPYGNKKDGIPYAMVKELPDVTT